MFPRNFWYVAADAHEVGRELLARTICNQKIVFWRKSDGTPVAFEDRCCHRRLPLRKGVLIEDRLRCGYHGLEFDAAGQCVSIPGQTTIPPGAEVRAYPVVERYKWIWIWMGDPARADPGLITPFPWRDDIGWGDHGTYFHVNCNYHLIIDNLLDQSHVAYVHASTIGSASLAETSRVRYFRGDDFVRVVRWVRDTTTPPTYQLMGGWGPDTRVDRWTVSEFRPPGTVRLFTGAAPGASGGSDFGFTELESPTPPGGFAFRNLNFVTPETATTAHYFWSNAYSARTISAENTERQFHQIFKAFLQDWDILELQEENWDNRPAIATNSDVALIAARQINERIVAEEARAASSVAAE